MTRPKVRTSDEWKMQVQVMRQSRVMGGLEDEEDEDAAPDDEAMMHSDADGGGDDDDDCEADSDGDDEGRKSREAADDMMSADEGDVMECAAGAGPSRAAEALARTDKRPAHRMQVGNGGVEGEGVEVRESKDKELSGGVRTPAGKAAGKRELKNLAMESIYSEREREAEKERAGWIGGVTAARSGGSGISGGEDAAAGGASAGIRATRGMIAGSARAPHELYIVIHNADTMGLRQGDAQRALAMLAAAPGVHLIVSMDHVNGALTWDPTLRAKFNWVWADLTTFARYTDESPYVAGAGIFAGEDQMKSALVVLRSLNNNSKGIMAIVIKHQLASKNSQGLTFAALYERCRENFLVSSESALKNHLAELKDHKIVREVRALTSHCCSRSS